MLNLFKSNKKIIEQIHSEFNTASEIALKGAKEILDRPMPAIDKAERLKKLGFSNVKEVEHIQKLDTERALFRKLADTIMYYATNYPQYKYITEEDVVKICRKYNLVRGKLERYTGFVPEKNMLEMEAFTIDPKDIDSENAWFYINERNDGTVSFGRRLTEEEVGFRLGDYTFYNRVRSQAVPKGFEICAPQKEMKINRTEYVEAKTKKIMQHIPDPVILQSVSRGGYLIVTAWGEEASDPLIDKD